MPLCIGCKFSFPVDSANYHLDDEQLKPGKYALQAGFVGKGVSEDGANLATAVKGLCFLQETPISVGMMTVPVAANKVLERTTRNSKLPTRKRTDLPLKQNLMLTPTDSLHDFRVGSILRQHKRRCNPAFSEGFST